jgi:hypothetical protein
MNFAGNAFTKNFSLLANGTHQYRIWANDSSNNSNVSQWRSLTVPPFVKIYTFPEGSINTMFVFKNQLYVGTYKNAAIYRSSDGVNWQQVFNGSNYTVPFGAVWAFEQFNNGSGDALYAAMGGIYAPTTNTGQAVIFKSYDGASWSLVANFTYWNQTQVSDLEAFNNTLWAITFSGTNGWVVYSNNDKDWYLSMDGNMGMSIKAKNSGLYTGHPANIMCWMNWTNPIWDCKTGLAGRSLAVFNDVIYASESKNVINVSNDLSTNYTLLTISDTGINSLFSASSLFASGGNNYGAIWRTSDGLVWTDTFSGYQNRSRGFAVYNATGDWRLYVGIAGPNWNIVNGGQAYLYRSTFTS